MARYELKLPQMGESVEEATVSSWLKKVGDTVQIDDILVEVATDKVDSEIPSDVSGVIVEILTPEKTVVKVGELMAIIETDVQEASPEPIIQLSSAEAPILIEPTQEAIVPVASQEHTQETTQVPEIQEEEIAQQVPYVPAPIQMETSKNEGITEEDPFFSPLVRTIAKEENISEEELRTIEGTGLAGRITKYDILRYIENKKGGIISTLPEVNNKQEEDPKVGE